MRGRPFVVVDLWVPTMIAMLLLQIVNSCFLLTHVYHLTSTVLSPDYCHYLARPLCGTMTYPDYHLSPWLVLDHLYHVITACMSLSCYCFISDYITWLLSISWYTCYLISHALLTMLIAQSNRRPAVSRLVSGLTRMYPTIVLTSGGSWKGAKCHVEQSATPHTWWGPPLESTGATSRVLFPSEQSATWSKVPHHTHGGGHLLNLWGPPLESVRSSIVRNAWCYRDVAFSVPISSHTHLYDDNPRMHVIWSLSLFETLILAYRSSNEFYWMCGLQGELSDVVGRRWESDEDNVEYYQLSLIAYV